MVLESVGPGIELDLGVRNLRRIKIGAGQTQQIQVCATVDAYIEVAAAGRHVISRQLVSASRADIGGQGDVVGRAVADEPDLLPAGTGRATGEGGRPAQDAGFGFKGGAGGWDGGGSRRGRWAFCAHDLEHRRAVRWNTHGVTIGKRTAIYLRPQVAHRRTSTRQPDLTPGDRD